ncbi:hypothetical protein B0H21DRAFT_250632 [Amylocystis lapponica]|nr:hypothetical protein B0H21DRAFT_250632 [Amylocystis lapponica]
MFIAMLMVGLIFHSDLPRIAAGQIFSHQTAAKEITSSSDESRGVQRNESAGQSHRFESRVGPRITRKIHETPRLEPANGQRSVDVNGARTGYNIELHRHVGVVSPK